MVLTNQVFREIVTDNVVYTGELVQIFAMISSKTPMKNLVRIWDQKPCSSS